MKSVEVPDPFQRQGGSGWDRLPVLINLKGPVELQVGLGVVVSEAGADRVLATDGPAARRRLLLD